MGIINRVIVYVLYRIWQTLDDVHNRGAIETGQTRHSHIAPSNSHFCLLQLNTETLILILTYFITAIATELLLRLHLKYINIILAGPLFGKQTYVF